MSTPKKKSKTDGPSKAAYEEEPDRASDDLSA